MAFESLIYTDCISSESVNGRSGFQFQAVSPKAGAELQTKVQRNVLYQVPEALKRADAPVEAYPPSFTYWRDDAHYVLAVGRYLGKEAGGRQGNQLTHALTTDDAEDILPAMPAQLYDAGIWLEEKAPSNELDTIPAPLLVSERFMPTALRELALESPDPRDLLAKFLTALEKLTRDPNSKLLIASDDAVTAARWIAMGALFFDRSVALGFSFRIFEKTPFEGSHRIAVFHPGTVERTVDIPRLSEVHSAVDLMNFQTSSIEPSESARTYADWFLDNNAYDALDAVEFGRAWEPYVPTPAVAAAIASAAVMGEREARGYSTADLSSLVCGLSRIPDGIEDHGDELVALFERNPEKANDGARHAEAFAALVAAGHLLLAEQLAVTSARMSEADPDGFGVVWAAALAGAEPYGPWDSRMAREDTLLALRRTRGRARGESLGDLMTVDRALGLETEWEAYRKDADRLAAAWVMEPALGTKLGSWSHQEHLVDLVRDRLEERLAGPEAPATAAEIRSGRWSALSEPIDQYNPRSRVSVTLASAMVHGAKDPQTQRARLRAYARDSVPENWSAFFPSRTSGDPGLLSEWLAAQPESVRDSRFATLVRDAVVDPAAESEIVADIINAVREMRDVAPPLDKVVYGDHRLEQIIAEIPDYAEGEFTEDLSAELAEVPPAVLRIRRHALVDAILRRNEYGAVVAVLESLPTEVSRETRYLIDDELNGAKPVNLEYFLIVWDRADRYESPVASPMRAALIDWYIRADRDGTLKGLASTLSRGCIEPLDLIAKAARTERRSGKRAIKDMKTFFERKKH